MNYNEGKEKYVTIKEGSIINGLIKEIGSTGFTILILIASYSDKEGYSRISQRDIAKNTGLSLPTVNKRVNEIIELEFEGEYILDRNMVKNGVREASIYKINKKLIKKI